jgi:hypothetical protein
MRAQFEAAVTPDDWRDIIQSAKDQAKRGDTAARAWLTPWLVGAEPKEVVVSGGNALRIEVAYVDGAE